MVKHQHFSLKTVSIFVILYGFSYFCIILNMTIFHLSPGNDIELYKWDDNNKPYERANKR